MPECKHMETRCCCGAAPNSPDCKGSDVVDLCELTEVPCDYSGAIEDTQDCWRWQERAANDWRNMAQEAVAILRTFRSAGLEDTIERYNLLMAKEADRD